MAQHKPEPPAESRRTNTASGVAVITAALMAGMTPLAKRHFPSRPEAVSGVRPHR
ncbi:hypothetical protein ACFY36_00435 [Actinoplanes sp. NPDC000266]